ncbi:hypothetical protein PhCBS80983_g00318 [Powellomyces hirtus]|uniref:RRM domain-containing protein n=1 Tax=Powellomyces hirtus TaxID=109895 RepID=A0A507EEE3_9FUNG|nr:hypothetical protein PhCBS80983_g00318 [Powellomyces hirtus]
MSEALRESATVASGAGPASSLSESSWKDDSRIRFVEETGKYIYTGDDEISYEWDDEKHAWFPMWDQNLIETQQAAYGPTIVEETPTEKPKGKRKQVYTSEESAAKKPKGEAKKKPNTSVYVTGLPYDTTEEELKEVFEKFGILMEDLKTGLPKIKLYRDAAGVPKGDALVSYFKEESVELACNLLDESDFRAGVASKIHVQKAVFQEKEKPPASEQPKPAARDKKVAQKKISKLEKRLDWFEEQPGKKAEKFAKMVVLKHMFTLKELEEDPALLLDLKEEVRGECEKLGEVTNIVLYDLEDSGVMTIRFKEVESAELCIRKMNGRFFAGRRIEAALFDGKSKYQQSKSDIQDDADEKQRLEAYEKWLEAQH